MATRATKVARTSPTTAILTDLQGQFSHMSTMLGETIAIDKGPGVANTRRAEALHLLQQRRDGLEMDDLIQMVALVGRDANAVETYLELRDDVIRRGWIMLVLGKGTTD